MDDKRNDPVQGLAPCLERISLAGSLLQLKHFDFRHIDVPHVNLVTFDTGTAGLSRGFPVPCVEQGCVVTQAAHNMESHLHYLVDERPFGEG